MFWYEICLKYSLWNILSLKIILFSTFCINSYCVMYPKCWLTVPNSKGYPVRYLDACRRQRVHTQSGNGRFLARTFHRDGKICPGWCQWGVHACPLFTLLPSRTNYKVAVYAPAERAYTSFISSLPLYVLCGCRVRCRYAPAEREYTPRISSLPPICTLWLQGAVYAPAERAPRISSLPPICTLWLQGAVYAGRYTPRISSLPLYVLCGCRVNTRTVARRRQTTCPSAPTTQVRQIFDPHPEFSNVKIILH